MSAMITPQSTLQATATTIPMMTMTPPRVSPAMRRRVPRARAAQTHWTVSARSTPTFAFWRMRSQVGNRLWLEATVATNPDLRVEHPDGERAVVVLAGEHDMSTAVELRHLLEQLVRENEVVVVDLSSARLADSTTLNVLVKAKVAANARDCRFRVQMGPDALLHRLFEVAGLLDAMEVVATREEALNGSERP